MEAECENCLRPLMDHFELVLSAQASSCEKTVLKRLLKELWRITMRNTEKLVVLPTVTDAKQVCPACKTCFYHVFFLGSLPNSKAVIMFNYAGVLRIA
ncbi:unnamed protein product [Dibothriocephalus latus]|uniref:MHD2 domain-containing protein n=1 Tax=Dibothriocephalus latus TaxID=60516 RepID=A0A3P7P672_DIBLA|nr:unnamed protein product [Dibothriocephalus latus]